MGLYQNTYIYTTTSDDTPLNLEDVKEIAGRLEEKFRRQYNREPKTLIIGLAPTGTFTLKSYNEDYQDMYDDIEDYLNGRVRDETKFKEFYTIKIVIY